MERWGSGDLRGGGSGMGELTGAVVTFQATGSGVAELTGAAATFRAPRSGVVELTSSDNLHDSRIRWEISGAQHNPSLRADRSNGC